MLQICLQKLLIPKTTAWNEFSSTMASAIICLATNQKFPLFQSFLNFEGKVKILDKESWEIFDVSKPSDPSDNIADEDVYKELGDSLVRAATTASSLEAKQDSGGPRCQVTIGDTIAQTRYQVNPKVSHLYAVKRIFRYSKGQPKLGLWYPKDSSFDLVAYTNSDYGGASLDRKSTTGGKAKKSVRLMMEKLFGMELELILAKNINGEVQLHALVDGKKIIITKSTVRRDLQLEDAKSVDCLPNSTIFEQLTLMGSKTTTWNEFSSTMASAIICLATNQKFNFSKYIFESMVRNLDNLSVKFLMYPRFMQVEGSSMPTDPQHTPTFIQPSPPPQKTQKPKKPNKKDTQVPEPTGPTNIIVDEAVHKELGDSLVRVATTASSLEAEHESGGGPRCQETIGDTIAQTRFKNVSKHSNDLLFARGNALRSDEDRLKLDELMALCTTLQTRVLDLEKTNTTQQNEIDSMKRRVKKLEKKRSSRTHKLKRLYKVSLSARVESSGDEANGEEVFVANKENDEVNVVEDATQVNAADNVVSTVGAATTVSAATTTTDDDGGEITLAQSLIEMKSTKPKVKGIVFQEPAKIDADHQLAKRLQAQEQEEFSDAEKATLFQQLLEKRRKHFAAKREEEKRNKPSIQAQQRKSMCTYLKNMEGKKLKDLKNKSSDSIQKMFDKAFKRVNTFVNFITDLVEGSLKRA
ncbi:hypothetical protein Tco_1215933 [Tanacetum coccineum]